MADTKWKPGQSGNPAGKPPGTRSVETLFRDAIAKIAKDNPEVKDVERELIITLLAKAKKGDMRALEMYLDRLYGKPKQSTDVKVDATIKHENLSAMSDKEIDEVRNSLL